MLKKRSFLDHKKSPSERKLGKHINFSLNNTMSLLVLQGPINSGKTSYLLEQFLQASPRKVIAVLPSAEQCSDWKERLLEKSNSVTLHNTSVLSVAEFFEKQPALQELELLIFDKFLNFDASLLHFLSTTKTQCPALKIIFSSNTCSAEKSYAAWLNSNHQKILSIADETHALMCTFSPEATISYHSVASPTEEARLGLQMIFASSPQHELTFCLRKDTSFSHALARCIKVLDYDGAIPQEQYELSSGNLPLGNSRIRYFEHLPVRRVQSLLFPELTLQNYPKLNNPNWFGKPDDLAAQEYFLFESWLQKTDHEAVLSFAQFNDEAREQIPSPFCVSFGSPAQLRPTIFVHENQPKLSRTIQNGRMTKVESLQLIAERLHERALSPTQLENFMSCPYAFFVENILRIKSKHTRDHELPAQERGTILHKLLEKFYHHYHQQWEKLAQSLTHEQEIDHLLRPFLNEILQEYPQEWERIAVPLRNHTLQLISQNISTLIWNELQSVKQLANPLLPKVFEWNFGNSSDPFEITLPSGKKMKLTGKVDRIDLDKAGTHFLVLDYKTGKNQDSLRNKIPNGEHLQLPLYHLAVQKKLFPRAQGLGAMIINVPEAQREFGWIKKDAHRERFSILSPRKAEFTPETWEDGLNSALAACDRIIQKIECGNFQTEKICDQCKRKNLERCRYQRDE